MKPGELRRFKDGLRGSEIIERVSGQPFVVINTPAITAGSSVLGGVDFLVGGRIETGWSLTWVKKQSEVLNEGR